jgi:2-polyprenyl-3-methyl-5-hydroxy-6-metoxy-1,4-benzoquinol methylase
LSFRVVPEFHDEDGAASWDRLVSMRAEQIDSGKDLTFNFVVKPRILAVLNRRQFLNAVDVGCGSGHLTHVLSAYCDQITGIDLSKQSIELASSRFATEKVRFMRTSLEQFAADHQNNFDLVVGNMFLMDTSDIISALNNVRRLLTESGEAIFTIPHPCFFPAYWGYVFEPWFKYMCEVAIEADFIISLDKGNGLKSVHFHRPLERYIETVHQAGLKIKSFNELMPTPEVEQLYPKPWGNPRYILFSCSRA